MDDLTCIVRTRFSVRSGKWPGFVPDASWLDFRFDLLSKCGIRAMQNQTMQSFVWLIEASPDTFVFLNTRLQKQTLPFVKAIISDGDDKEGFPLLTQEQQNLIPDARRYLTVRVDSDDVLHPRTLEAFSSSVSENTPLVSIESGYKFDWFSGKMYKHHYNHSAFLGLLSDEKTGFLGNGGHKTVRRHYNHINLVDIPFIQIIHDSNVRAGLVKDAESLSEEETMSILQHYGIQWSPSVPMLSGQSNPRIKLKRYLGQTWEYKMLDFFKKLLRR